MPLISIIIPTYNGEKYLAQALESVVAQGKVDDIECVVVDDGSTDNTLAILASFSEKLPLVIVKKEAERGWVASSNLALQKVRGVFSCFLHQDDVWLPGRLALLRQWISQSPDIDCFFTAAQFVDASGNRLGRWAPRWDALPQVNTKESLLNHLLVQNVLAIPAPLFRTQIAREVGGLDEKLWYTADWDFWLKFVAVSEVGYLLDETVGFRVHANSQTVVRSGEIEAFRAQMDVVLKRHTGWLTHKDVCLRAAQFSIDVNVALAAVLHGNFRRLHLLVAPILRCDWRLLYMYFSCSTIGARVLARLRAGLQKMS